MKTMKVAALATAMAALAAATTPASAADGFALSSGLVRAGPATDYPVVGRIGAGEPLVVYGCTARYGWCDVSAADDRGWFPGRRIALERDGRRVALPTVAGLLGLSIVGFSLGDYWGTHYRHRPWYEDRRWRHGPREPRPHRFDPRPHDGMHRPPIDRPPRGDTRPPGDRPPRGDVRPPREPRPFPPPGGGARSPSEPGRDGGIGTMRPDGGAPAGGPRPGVMPGIGGSPCSDGGCR